MAKEKKTTKGSADDASAEQAQGPWPTPRLKTRFNDEIRSQFAEKFGVTNPMAVASLDKIVVNVNMGRHLDGTKIPPNIRSTVLSTLTKISGQKPIVAKAKRSVSNFKVREGYESSAYVTLRRDHMWHFLDRMVNLVTPRIKDFQGLKRTSFDRQGSYSMGLTEQGVFPEINMAEVNFTHGMNINFVFTNSNAEKSLFVLEALGMPFEKSDKPAR